MNTYDIGDVVRITSQFAQSAVAIDPGTVTLRVLGPSGTVTNYSYAAAEITKDATGSYHVDMPITVAGTYRYRWTSTGTGAASEEGFFQVRTRRVA